MASIPGHLSVLAGGIFLYLGVLILLAATVFRLVEEPANRFLKSRLLVRFATFGRQPSAATTR